MKNKISTLSAYLLVFIPTISFAAFGGINDLLRSFGGLVKLAIPIAYGLAVLFFFYGVAKYILHADDEKAAKDGKSIMVYGVIGLFVISSIWGIVNFIGVQLNITSPAGSGNTPGLNGNDLFGTNRNNG